MSGDIIDRLFEQVTGWAPFTPITVDCKTTPKDAAPCPSDNDLIEVYGSGPVPIERRGS